MSNYLNLTHLTFLGDSAQPVALDFSQTLTVVYGASDTGKSFVCSAIDYMFRGRLKDIPEMHAYRSMLLGLDCANGDTLTLLRGVEGGNAFAFNRDSRLVPTEPPDEVLTTSGGGRKGYRSLSTFLLDKMHLGGSTIRRKLDGTSRDLSVRDLAHLTIIDEVKMQSAVPPAQSGQYVSRTAEQSVMRLLLTGEDDAPLETLVSDVQRRMTNAQRELLQTIVSDLRSELEASPSPGVLAEQVNRLNESVAEATQRLSGLIVMHDAALSAISEQQRLRSGMQGRLTELQETSARFRLLAQQYESDLRRLALLSETGDLLGLFRSDICIFCGSDVSNHQGEHQNGGITPPAEFGQSVDSETSRVSSLLGDLRGTLGDVDDEILSVTGQLARVDELLLRAVSDLDDLEEQLSPRQTNLDGLLEARDQAVRLLGKWQSVADLELRVPKALPALDDAQPSSSSGLEAGLRELASKMQVVLRAWGFPGAQQVRIDETSFEPIVDDRKRGDRGKGVRAMQHAAFTVAVAEYCIERQLPHPGFVVLDSPLVTYREPEADDREGTPAVPDAFYQYLASDFPGQAIVLENTPPPAMSGDTLVYHLTGIENAGRYGFF